MAKPKEAMRNYTISDGDMLQLSRVFHTLYVEDTDLFSALDPSLGGIFGVTWMQKIVAAENAARDLTVVDELTGLTAAVEEKMEACRVHFQQMKYFIEKAFPDNIAIQNAFGFEDYEIARRSEAKLLPFMKSLHAQAVKYSAELIAVSYTQENIDKIGTLWQELLDADQEQENFKKQRPVKTQERIKTLNDAWKYVLKINRASKIVFADNYAKLQQYALPYEKTSEPEPEPEPEEPTGEV